MASLQQLTIYVIGFDDNTPSRKNCRSIVEHILQKHLVSKKSIRLDFDKFGKPRIGRYENLAFSYSHSAKQLAVAVHEGEGSLGIDTEPLSRVEDLIEISEYAFSPAENTVLSNEEYVSAWCKKEAAVKQLGKGFLETAPSELTFQSSQAEYELHSVRNKIQNGYFIEAIIKDNVIVVCSDSLVKNFQIRSVLLSDIQMECM